MTENNQISDPQTLGRFSYCFNYLKSIILEHDFMKTIERVKEVLSKRIDPSKLKEDTALNELGLDSLDLVELTLELEDIYSVSFTSVEIADLKTIKDVAELIEKKRK